VVWISCGQELNDEDLLKRQRDLAKHLGVDPTFGKLEQGQGALPQLLADKAVLLVLDDVWRAADALAFEVLGPRGRMLITTRDKGILNALHGELVPVSLLTETAALQLLADIPPECARLGRSHIRPPLHCGKVTRYPAIGEPACSRICASNHL